MLDMVRAGVDRHGFDAVFGAHHRPAVRLAYLLTSDEHQAEDVVAEAFTKIYPRWQAGEIILLCSDGLSNEVDDEAIEQLLNSGKGLRQMADALLESALEAGGRDNISVVLVQSPENGQSPRPWWKFWQAV